MKGMSVKSDPPESSDELRLAPGVSIPAHRVQMSYSSSRGPGGQNVNRRATKAELRLSMEDLPVSDGAKRRLRIRSAHLVTAAGELVITCGRYRSQSHNRRACMHRLCELVALAIVEPRKRRKTRPTRGSIQRRLDSKRRRSDTKQRRRPPEGE